MAKQVKRRKSADIQIGPNMKKPGAVKNMVIGVTIGTVLFFLVSWIMVYGTHLHH